jgi:phage terminase large subunit
VTLAEQAAQKLRAWREYPAQFVHDNFGVEPDAWQVDALNALGGGFNSRRRLCMKACTGPGKSALLAWAGWHRLACFAARGEHPKGAALSITRDNLKDNLWAELSKWQKRSPFLTAQFTWTKEQIYANDHPETWFLSARSFAKDADSEAIGRALSGLHSQFPFILLDEIGDMPVAVGRAAEQIFTGSPSDAAIIAAGNPTSTTGLLYLICTNQRGQYVVITITADPDDPKRTPRVDIELAREQIRENGRDNPWVMATILGLFPPAGFNALLGVEDVEKAMRRHYQPDRYDFAAKILGVDVAREGDDRSVIFPRQGLVAFRPKLFRNVRSNELAGHTAQAMDKWGADGIIVDGTGGWGSGVIDSLHSMGRAPFDCQFSGKPFLPKYANKRAEIWFEMAEWVKNGGALPNLPDLVAELTTPTYSFSGDRLLVEPKDQIKKRLGRSPDLADALACTFAFPIAPKPAHPALAQGNHAATDYDPLQPRQEQRRDAFDYNPIQ